MRLGVRPRHVLAGIVLSAVVVGAVHVATQGGRAAAQSPRPEVTFQKAEGAFVPTASSVFTVLAIGSDARRGEGVVGQRADSLHLIAVNPKQRAATILGFPRDAWVSIPGHGKGRINTALDLGGPELVVRTVEQLTNIRVDYYLLTAFKGFSRMVDGIGGITVDVPYAMDDFHSGADFAPGPRRMTGGEALAFSRNRHDTPDGDFGRSLNQGRVLLAALDELQGDFANEPGRLLTWVAVGGRHVTTNVPIPELMRLGLIATSIPATRVRNVVAPGSIGFAGPASVVFLSPAAQSLFADVRDDGLV